MDITWYRILTKNRRRVVVESKLLPPVDNSAISGRTRAQVAIITVQKMRWPSPLKLDPISAMRRPLARALPSRRD